MNSANPANARRSLELAQALARVGIDFVVMPVHDEADRINLASQAADRMARMVTIAESTERVGVAK